MPSKRMTILDTAKNRLNTIMDISPEGLIGAVYVFGDGEDEHFIIGSIQSAGFSPDEGLKLYVSSPRYRGVNISHLLALHDRKICIMVREDKSQITGKLFLLK